MKIEKNSSFHYDLKIPSSKSFINRALILASLIPDEIIIGHVSESNDVLDLICLLEKIGLIIEKKRQDTGLELSIKNSFPACEKVSKEVVTLESGEGGTTNRFLIALLALGKNRYQLIPSGALAKRPMAQMWDILESCSVHLEKNSNPWPSIQGPIFVEKNLKIDCSNTTQIASAFAMILWDREQQVSVKTSDKSSGYFDMTLSLINRVKNGERKLMAPIDFSSLGYLVAYGVHIRSVLIPGIVALDPYQPDSVLIKLLRQWGVKIDFKCRGMSIIPTEIEGFSLDCSKFPDLVPTLAFLASYAKSRSVLHNIENLRHKESDRIATLLELLEAFSIEAHYDDYKDCLEIIPSRTIDKPVTYHAPQDHRLAMTAMLLMMKNSGGEIINFFCVKKSFPQLIESGAILPPK
jgi:3-phosphoshikimate 1-carboxyvinyltransferase